MNQQKLGKVKHYYNNLEVALVKLDDHLNVGEKVHFIGHSTDFDQAVDSLELEHKKVESADNGDLVAIKVKDKVREGDDVIKEW